MACEDGVLCLCLCCGAVGWCEAGVLVLGGKEERVERCIAEGLKRRCISLGKQASRVLVVQYCAVVCLVIQALEREASYPHVTAQPMLRPGKCLFRFLAFGSPALLLPLRRASLLRRVAFGLNGFPPSSCTLGFAGLHGTEHSQDLVAATRLGRTCIVEQERAAVRGRKIGGP